MLPRCSYIQSTGIRAVTTDKLGAGVPREQKQGRVGQDSWVEEMARAERLGVRLNTGHSRNQRVEEEGR